jgi:hypothetical protein
MGPMRKILCFGCTLFLCGFETSRAAVNVSAAVLDAYVQHDGSVRFSYRLNILADGGPVDSLVISLPTPSFRLDQIRAYRCDEAGLPAERGGRLPLEKEGLAEKPLPVQRHPDPDHDTEFVVDLRAAEIPAGREGAVCADLSLPDYLRADHHCSDSAYVSVRPTLNFNGNKKAEIFVNIHLPADVSEDRVLAQQEFPQEQIKPFLPVEKDLDHPVVRWHCHGPLGDVYWIAAIFPGKGFRLGTARDALQTDIRLIPRETLELNAYIRENGQVDLQYSLQLDNTGGCHPVDTVQFVLPGRPSSIRAEIDENAVEIRAWSDFSDRLRPFIGNQWYQAYNAILASKRIFPGQTATLRVDATVVDELFLSDPANGSVSFVLNATASAAGVWQEGSSWTTRIHMPAGVAENDVLPIDAPFASRQLVDRQVVVAWVQHDNPSPVGITFPLGRFRNVRSDYTDPAQWRFILTHHDQFPDAKKIVLTSLLLLSVIAFSVYRRILRKGR